MTTIHQDVADVISFPTTEWTDKPLGELSEALHNKLSSRSRKSVEDILEAAKRRQHEMACALRCVAVSAPRQQTPVTACVCAWRCVWTCLSSIEFATRHTARRCAHETPRPLSQL